jgi:Putative restriction endonuclease
MTVVIEILSPSNTWREMPYKALFYNRKGVEELYIYNPETNELTAFGRSKGSRLHMVNHVGDFVSPRMGVRFDLSGPELALRHADGRPFLTFEELESERVKADRRADLAEQQFHRLARLVRRQATQQATPEELAELQRLLSEP